MRVPGRRRVQRGEAVGPVGVDVPHGVGHAERFEDVGLHEVLERHAGGDLDHPAEHVEPHRVLPLRARLEHERQRGEVVDDVGEVGDVVGDAPLEAGLAVERVDGVVLHEPVRQAGHVRRQVPDAQLLGDRLGHRGHARPAAPHPGAPANDGMYRRTGSLSSNRPCSHATIAATAVIGLVIE